MHTHTHISSSHHWRRHFILKLSSSLHWPFFLRRLFSGVTSLAEVTLSFIVWVPSVDWLGCVVYLLSCLNTSSVRFLKRIRSKNFQICTCEVLGWCGVAGRTDERTTKERIPDGIVTPGLVYNGMHLAHVIISLYSTTNMTRNRWERLGWVGAVVPAVATAFRLCKSDRQYEGNDAVGEMEENFFFPCFYTRPRQRQEPAYEYIWWRDILKKCFLLD